MVRRSQAVSQSARYPSAGILALGAPRAARSRHDLRRTGSPASRRVVSLFQCLSAYTSFETAALVGWSARLPARRYALLHLERQKRVPKILPIAVVIQFEDDDGGDQECWRVGIDRRKVCLHYVSRVQLVLLPLYSRGVILWSNREISSVSVLCPYVSPVQRRCQAGWCLRRSECISVLCVACAPFDNSPARDW